jgi:hypothetical protein
LGSISTWQQLYFQKEKKREENHMATQEMTLTNMLFVWLGLKALFGVMEWDENTYE